MARPEDPRPQVGSLTLAARGPASRFLPCFANKNIAAAFESFRAPSSWCAQGIEKPRLRVVFQMARPEGLEPSTYRLTAGRSTIELRANKSSLPHYYTQKNSTL